jgi:cytochrome oxidase assembly protein ShyY1
VGRYDAAYQLLARNRPVDGRAGYYVLTPLVTQSGAALLVNRGWVPSGATAAAAPDVPPPPSGEVAVIGRVRASERARHRAGLPAGQVDRINLPAIAAGLPYPVYGDYAELTEQRPAPAAAPRPVPPPELSEGPHLAYAFQWFAFALIAVIGWVLLLRREWAEQQEAGQPGLRSSDRHHDEETEEMSAVEEVR